MARRTFELADVAEILADWYAGQSISEVSVRHGVDRKTVRKYVAPAVAAGLRAGGPAVSAGCWASLVEQHFPQIADGRLRQTTWLQLVEHHGEISRLLRAGVRQSTIHRWLCDEAGVTVSLASFKRYVAAYLPGVGRPAGLGRDGADPDAGPRVACGAGRMARRRRTYVLVAAIACLRYLLLRPVSIVPLPRPCDAPATSVGIVAAAGPRLDQRLVTGSAAMRLVPTVRSLRYLT